MRRRRKVLTPVDTASLRICRGSWRNSYVLACCKPALLFPQWRVGFSRRVRVWILCESCSFSYAWLAWCLLLFELGLSGDAGLASSLCSANDPFTYAGTQPMIILVCRAPRFSTEEERCFWQAEIKFV